MPWPETRKHRHPSRPKTTDRRAAREQKVSLFLLGRLRPALLAAGPEVSRLLLRASCTFLSWGDDILQMAALRLETPVAVPWIPEVVGADDAHDAAEMSGTGTASGHLDHLSTIVKIYV